MQYQNFTWPGYDGNTLEDQVLRDFLILDIQQNKSLLAKFLHQIRQLMNGHAPEKNDDGLEFGGNVFLCSLHARSASIDILQDATDFGDAKQYDLETLEIAASAWMRFLEAQ